VSTDREAFAEQRRRIMRLCTPSRGDDLLGMEMDFHAYLSMLDEIDDDSVSARRTGNPEWLISASCSPAEGATVTAAAEAVRSAWLESLRYEFTEAHHLVLDSDLASLEVVTQTAPYGLYVTGVIEIRPAGPRS
jgi:hypothetical protein